MSGTFTGDHGRRSGVTGSWCALTGLRPRRFPRTAPRVHARTKQSTSRRVLVLPDGQAVVTESFERGPSIDRPLVSANVLAPSTPERITQPSDRLVDRTRAIRDAVARAAGGIGVSVELSRSVVVDRRRSGPRRTAVREVTAVEIRLGPDPLAPLWTRTVLWPARRGDRERSLSALAELVSMHGRILGAEPSGPDPRFDRGEACLVLADAAADLVRLGMRRWATRPPGTRVGSRTLEIVAPDRPFAPGRAAVPLVRRGTITPALARPRRRLDGSWRDPPGRGWPLLAVRAHAAEHVVPADALVLAGVLPLGGRPWGRGARLAGGRVVGRWGPAPIPEPGWWFVRHAAGFGDPLVDATGVPVATAGFVAR